MTELSMDTARMLDMLPESEQVLAHEFVKRLVLAWDPDFTKVTPEEARQMEQALLDKYAAYNLGGEFFSVNFAQACLELS